MRMNKRNALVRLAQEVGLTALYGFWQRWLSPFECAGFGKTWKEQEAEEMLMARIQERQEAKRKMYARRVEAMRKEGWI